MTEEDERTKVARTLRNARNRQYLGRGLSVLKAPIPDDDRFNELLQCLTEAERKQDE
ncbi:hypothetical protein OSJ77_20105 [Phyllobacterium sp. 0TCS1.6C]|jgi:hypothetical protein|uniref:hypothetical protein n=1 Tax=unclassified Phyllobacterium TaxID=2638441 RepID=UPI002264D7F4|nr:MULTISPECIES: hypothetical protein [unclassified Phyllobacterium]MCX8282499.1 hypothetical protein [Phyllobacterium sp. 0TCS1.6C]MCX8292591.1 hypothetical protein [Phyllobacterium sp. 0TCS1.6A]